MANYIAYALAALLLAALILLFIYWRRTDQAQARWIKLREIFRLYLFKARADRNDKIRMPAHQVVSLLDLADERTLADWEKPPVKQRRHPSNFRGRRRK